MAEPSVTTAQTNRLPKEPLIVAALIVFVSVSLAVGGIVFKTRDSIQRDKVEFLADANQKQVAPLRRVIQLRLAQDKARLIQFAATRSALGPGRSRVFGDFALVSLLTPTTGGQWGLSWIEKGPLYPQLQNPPMNPSPQAALSSDQEIALLKSLPYDRIREGDIHWQRLSDSSGRPIWALAVSVETQASSNNPTHPSATTLPEGTDYQSVQVGTGGRAVVVGFFGRNPLLTATEDFIGSTSTAFVIDSRGYAATHSNKAMIGSLLRDDPAVKEVFSARSSAGATRYQNRLGTKVFSAFEQVDRANLYVVMATPETAAAGSGQSFGRTAVTTGALALIVGFFLVFAWGAKLLPRAGVLAPQQLNRIPGAGEPVSSSSFVLTSEYGRPNAIRAGVGEPSRPLELPEEYRKKTTPIVGSNGSGAVPTGAIEREVSTGQIMAQAADRAAFVGRFVSGLQRGMKEPLLAAMAHVQLVKVKSGDTPSAETMREIADHISSVDRDLRRAKEMIDDLGQLSSQSGTPGPNERADLNRLVSSIVDLHQSTFGDDGIALSSEMVSVPLVRGREEPLRKALAEILKNAQRSLKGRANKAIRIKLEDKGDTVAISVTDNGVGMDRETKAQAFEPFFHGFDDPAARGLGLATVRSIVQSQGGSCELKSAPGDGTTITLQWPVLASERETFANRPVKVQASEVFENTISTVGNTHASSLDFAKEGAFALGGKVPLSPEHAGSLPPAPRFGAEDDEEEAWSFDHGKGASVLGEPTAVAEKSETAITEVVAMETGDSSVKIRPVRRG